LESVAQLRTAISGAIDSFRIDPATEILPGSKRSSFLHNPKWIWTGVAIAIIAVATMTIWHLMGEPGSSSKVLERLTINSNDVKKTPHNESSPIEIMVSDTPKQSILAEDGASMHFVPAGMVTLAESSHLQLERSVKVNPFYMDETLVTNHQFVEFLNHNLSMIRVERGVARADDEIWLLLGEVMEDYEPIVFRKGEFKVSKIAYASLPALRVTAYGASSYARFYNRRLPTYTEWLHALGNVDSHTVTPSQDVGNSNEGGNGQSMHDQMHSRAKSDISKPKTPDSKLSSVINDQPNKYGIRGLNKNIKEWGLNVIESASRDNTSDTEFVVLPSTIQRYPWEGFEEVGFRCVRKVKIKAE
jgi:serine/threonine-protein kinase